MGIISKLKSALGVAGDGTDGATDDGTPVVVEREPEAASERAVKGIDPPAGSTSDAADESPSAASRSAVSGREPADAGESVDVVKGIGPAYADRLADVGVATVSDLAEADPEELAAAIDLGAGRVGNWVERAKARTR